MDFIGKDAHILIRPKDKRIETIDIYYNKDLKKYISFNITEYNVVGAFRGGFKETYTYIMKNIDRTTIFRKNNKVVEHVIFEYPTTWAAEKKGRLLYEIDDAVWKDDSIKNLLLMLL